MARPKQRWLVLGASIIGGVGAAGALAAAARRRRTGEGGTAARFVPRPDSPPPPLAERRGAGRPKRAYRLSRGEPAAEGLRRIAVGRLDHALEALEAREADAASVHEARKDLKKLRAALRLLRGALGKERYRSEAADARDAGRLLAGARDARVRLDTLDLLIDAEAIPAGSVGTLRARLETELRTSTAGEGTTKEPAARIAAARERVGALSLEGDGWTIFGPGVTRSYRRGRARMSDALARPTVESLHEWRKRVKDLWYHLRILAPAWPPVIEALAEEAHVLSERLGDDHDLAVLASSARDHHDAFEDPGDLDALLDAIGRRRAELQADARSLGARIYADRPDAFAARTEAWWRAWRGDDEESVA